jgi:dihydrolipoamide dehydrogenase
LCRRTPLGIVFCTPQIARVGPPLSKLPDDIVMGEVDFSRQGRARIAIVGAGMLRLYARPSNDRLLGAEMCVPGAEHMAHLLALAIEQGMDVSQILAMPFYHPVLEEGLRSALRDLSRKLHIQGGSDLSDCADIGHDALD